MWATTTSGSSMRGSHAQVFGNANCGSTTTAASSSPAAISRHSSVDAFDTTETDNSAFSRYRRFSTGGSTVVNADTNVPNVSFPRRTVCDHDSERLFPNAQINLLHQGNKL